MTTKSKREIERRLDEIDEGPSGEYPQLDSLAMVLGYEWENVDSKESLYRRVDSSQVYHMPPEFRDILKDLVDSGMKKIVWD